ncbi:MAG: hypothetical protein Q4F95_08650 [Oscillospiraceae bacterium]|nr:hypothetical protein [Oscillospiraceae bacterium]
MTKALKICGIVLGAAILICIIAYIIILIFVPGLFLYLHTLKECPNINDKIEEYPYYDTVVPDDYQKVKAGVFYISGPMDDYLVGRTSSVKTVFKNSERNFMVMSTSSSAGSVDFSDSDYPDLDKSDYIHFFESIKYNYPQNNKEMKIFIRNGLNLRLSLHLRGKDKKVYKQFASKKEMVSGLEKIYAYKKGNVDCFVCNCSISDSKKSGTFWSIDAYTGDNAETVNKISISSNDIDEIKKVIASVEMAE